MRLTALTLMSAALLGAAAQASVPADVLYGTALDKIVTIDTQVGTITDLEAQEDFAFQGISFGPGGRLFVSACVLVPIGVGDLVDCALAPRPKPDYPVFFQPYDQLVEVDPVTGAVLGWAGPMTDTNGTPLDMRFLAFPPQGDVIYGIDVNYEVRPETWRLWAIDPDTAEPTVVTDRIPAGCELGPDCGEGTGLAARPDGSLLHVSLLGPPLNRVIRLLTLSPTTGAELASLELANSGLSLAQRSDGTIFSAIWGRRLVPPELVTVWFMRLSTIDPGTGEYEVLADADGGPVRDIAFSPLAVESIAIEIEPGGGRAVVNPASRGVIPVAILGSETFDVADVDAGTLAFGPGGAPLAHRNGPHVKDANRDRIPDLLAHFRTEESGIGFGDAQACVTGELLDGTPFEGCDSVGTVPACGIGCELALLLPPLSWMRRRRVRG